MTSMEPPLPAASRIDEQHRVARAYARWVGATLPRQVMDGGPDDGAFNEYEHGWRDGRWSAFTLAKLISARLWIDRLDLRPGPLDAAIRRSLAFIVRRQNSAGEIDLGGSYSPNEVGFTLPGLAEAYRRIVAHQLLEDCHAPLETYLRKGAEAVVAGEAHTANHRWAAACAPLAAVHALWPDGRYVKKIEQYLADGIDCDSDGLWHVERCPGYADVACHGMLVLADRLARPDLLDHVVRACNLATRLIQPNGEQDTSFSHRQSRAAPNAPGISYLVARRAAIASGDGRLASLAALAARRDLAADMLYPLPLAIDEHPGPLPDPLPLPTTYDLHLRGANILRRRRGETAITIAVDSGNHFFDTVRDAFGGAKRSDDWLHLHHGQIVLQSLHVAVANMHNLQPESQETTPDHRTVLAGQRSGWRHSLHFRPGRPQVEVPWRLEHRIEIQTDLSGHPPRFCVRIQAHSPCALAANLRFWIRAGATAREGERTPLILKPRQHLPLAGGFPLELRAGDHRLTVVGLPHAEHGMIIAHPDPIPSAKAMHCAVLELGLRMPVHLDLCFILE